ncbi:hypothetical protein BDK89_4299 [Ilumatobacter fluminis]|uniref:Uncharacterized protein n=2 Tax=Ilumatobacter fluminis TaxID=467091 RepID=A0A4R7I6J2_9ACTN|nr:hypothetical protein BDK89_4299 [Ilumatobacter fluminis]
MVIDMNTNTITETITDTLTDTVPSAIAGTLSDVGSIIETVPGVVVDSVDAGVTSGRRFARKAAGHVPGVSAPTSNRRWWLMAALLATLAVVGTVWYTRRSSNDSSGSDADVANIDARRHVA